MFSTLEVKKKNLNVKSRTSNRYPLGGKGRTVISSKYLQRLGKRDAYGFELGECRICVESVPIKKRSDDFYIVF